MRRMRASAPALFPSRLQASDERLVGRVRAGDARAFEAIYDRYERSLRSFCRHLLGQPEDADDAVQHTFLAAYRTIHDGDRDVDLRPWLFTVARNRCRSLLRSRRHSSALGADSLEPSTEGLTAAVERRESLRDLLRDIAALPEDQRAALILTQLETLKHDEVARVLGVPSEKVRALVFQARSSLASTRRARDTACHEIREQLTSLNGPALRRGNLRRHLHGCTGCRDFELTLKRQRAAIVVLLPVVAAPALRGNVLGQIAAGGPGAAAGTWAGAAGSGGALGGLAGGGVALKAAVVAVSAAVAGTGVATVTTGGVPDATHRTFSPPVSKTHAPGARVALLTTPRPRAGSPRAPSPSGHARPVPSGQSSGPAASSRAASPPPAAPPGVAKQGGTPPGLGRHRGSPPGLAKQGGTPPGLAKKRGTSQGKGVGQPSPNHSHGSPPGQAKGKEVTPPGPSKQPLSPTPPGNGESHGNPGNGNGYGNGTGNGNGNGKPTGPPGGGKGH